MRIRTHHEDTIIFILFGLIVVTLPFSVKLNSISIVCFSIYNFWIWFHYKAINKNNFPFLFSHLLILGISILGLINTSNIIPALKLFETRLPIVMFPLLFFVAGNHWDKEVIKRTLLLFVAVTILSGLIIQVDLIFRLIEEKKSLSYFFYWRNSGAALSEVIGIHPTYLSMYGLFSIGILFEFFTDSKKINLRTSLGFVLIVYLSILVLHLASRISLLALIIVLAIIAVKSVFQYRLKSLILILPGIVIIYLLFNLELFAVKSRLENQIGNPLDFKGTILSESYDQRVIAWNCSYEIIKENIWFGVGTGDATSELNRSYNDLGAFELVDKNLNSHNQYLDAMIRNGIFGLISLLILYFFGGLKTKGKMLFVIFMVTVCVTSLTENIIDRQKGVVFFAMFNSLLFGYYKE